MKTSEQIHRACNIGIIEYWKKSEAPEGLIEEAIFFALDTVADAGAFTKDNDVRACTEGKAPFITVWIACGQSVWMVHPNTDTAEAYIKSYQP